MSRLWQIIRTAALAAAVAFVAAFPASAIVADLNVARDAVTGAVAAGVGAAAGGLYVLAAHLWGRAGNWLRRWKASL